MAAINAPRLASALQEALGLLAAASTYRDRDPENTLRAYTETMLDVDPDIVLEAARRWIKDNDRFPTPRQFRFECRAVMDSRRLDAIVRPAVDPSQACPLCGSPYAVYGFERHDGSFFQRIHCAHSAQLAATYQKRLLNEVIHV